MSGSTPTRVSMTADDFFTGMIAALAIKGERSISIREDRFDRAMELAYRELLRRAEKEALDVEFRIRRHPLHGDSQTIRACLSSAIQNDLVSLDNPEYQDLRIKIDANDARRVFEWLPGSEELFSDLADELLTSFSNVHT